MAEEAPRGTNEELPPDFHDAQNSDPSQEPIDPQQLEEFRAHTFDGQAIEYHRNGIKGVELLVDLALRRAVHESPHVDPTDMRSPAEQMTEDHAREHKLRVWAQENGLTIDFNAIARVTRDYGTPRQRLDHPYVQRLEQDELYVRRLPEILGNHMARLGKLEEELIRHPEFRINSPVPMRRTGKDEHIQEEGWEVAGILANGDLLTINRREKLEKAEPIGRLMKWRNFVENRKAASQVSNEVLAPETADVAQPDIDRPVIERPERLAYPNLKYGVAERAEHGEDRNLVMEDIGLFLVCDGVSKARGAVAAQMTKDIVGKFFENKKPEDYANADPALVAKELQQALQLASNTIAEQAPGSATTGTLALVLPSGVVAYAHAADSRLHHLAKETGTLIQITKDETMGAELKAAGVTDQAVIDYQSSVITNWLGMDSDTGKPMQVVQSGYFTVKPGDSVGLFSDGVTDYSGDEKLIEWMREANPQTGAQRTVDEAIKHDDRTAQIVRIGQTVASQNLV